MKKIYFIYLLLLFSNYCNAQFYCDTSYFPNSKKISCLGFYDKNEKCWIQKGFFYDGKISRIEKYNTPNYNNKNFQTIAYHENGIEAIKYEFKNERLDNTYEENYFNGNKKIKGAFYNGFKNGEWTTYYESGGVKSISYFQLSKKDSSFNTNITFQDIDSFPIEYFQVEWGQVDNSLGDCCMFINIKKIKLQYLMSTPVGIWKEYDEKGNLINTVNYNKKRRKKNNI